MRQLNWIVDENGKAYLQYPEGRITRYVGSQKERRYETTNRNGQVIYDGVQMLDALGALDRGLMF